MLGVARWAVICWRQTSSYFYFMCAITSAGTLGVVEMRMCEGILMLKVLSHR